MTRKSVLYLLLVFSLLTTTLAGRFGGKSRGGGGGSHHYPPSRTGLSGNGASHSYPHSNSGLSGNQQPVHQTHVNNLNNARPHDGGHAYPQSNTGLSGNNQHGYPNSPGLSGNNKGGYNTHNQPTVINNHYYQPPQQIHYTPSHGGPPMSYPVYHGQPPSYVYKYQDSGSKYAGLLTGLALMNLGLTATSLYSHAHSGSNSHKTVPGEVCKFQIKDGKNFEETIIPCYIVSGILSNNNKTSTPTPEVPTTTKSSNETSVNMTTLSNVNDATTPSMPENVTMTIENKELAINSSDTINNSNTTLETTTATPVSSITEIGMTQQNITQQSASQNITQPDALSVKGPPIEVTPQMECFVLKTSPTSRSKKEVPCKLLEEYSKQSLRKASPNSGSCHTPTVLAFVSIVLSVSAFV